METAALQVCCSHYSSFKDLEVRKLKNRAHSLQRRINRLEAELRAARERHLAWQRAAQDWESRYASLLTAVRRLASR